MKKIIIFSVILLTALTGNLFSQTIGKFALVIGNVEIREKGGSWSKARSGSPISDNTEVNTGFKSSAIIALNNGTRLKLAQASFIAMETYKEGNFGSASDVNLRQGKVTAFVEKIQSGDRKNLMRIRTPTLVAGVRGTIQEVSHDPDQGSSVVLHESSAEVIGNSGRKNQVPERGEMSKDNEGNTETPEMKSNKKQVNDISDSSMSDKEKNSVVLKEDPLFGGTSADMDQLIESTAHIEDAYKDFFEEFFKKVPVSIERL